MGKMGAGKTLSMSMVANYIHLKTGIPIYANYKLKNSKPFTSLKDLWGLDTAIVCFDEIWLSLDSRMWSDNVVMTRWINQTRKKRLLVMYTTQHINQVEMRVRKGTDVLVYAQKRPEGRWLNFIDYQYNELGRRYLLNPQAEKKLYGLYDTYEVVQPIAIK